MKISKTQKITQQYHKTTHFKKLKCHVSRPHMTKVQNHLLLELKNIKIVILNFQKIKKDTKPRAQKIRKIKNHVRRPHMEKVQKTNYM